MRCFKGKNFCFDLSRTYVMGVLNVTPDSFSDGGRFFDAESAVSRALLMQSQKADIIDVGASSTSPGREAIPTEDEISRLAPVLAALSEKISVPISVDTTSPDTAEYALLNGASIINDVSGRFNPLMAAVAEKYGAGWIITHGGSSDSSNDFGDKIFDEVSLFFRNSVTAAEACGINRSSICLDPGIGFGKSRNDDALLLRNIGRIDNCGCAVLVGASRKRVIGEACGEENPELRVSGTVAAHTAAIFGGADIIRVHDVFEGVQGACVADAMFRHNSEAKNISEDKIIIDNLTIFAYHGVNPEEKQYGQNFIVDIEAYTDLSVPCSTDNVDDTVSYAKIIKCVRRLMTEESYDLIEKAAQVTADGILSEFPTVRCVKIRLKKPDAPIKANFGYVGIEITRNR